MRACALTILLILISQFFGITFASNPGKPVKTTVREVVKGETTKVITKETYANGKSFTTIHEKKTPARDVELKQILKTIKVEKQVTEENGIGYEETIEHFSDGSKTITRVPKAKPTTTMIKETFTRDGQEMIKITSKSKNAEVSTEMTKAEYDAGKALALVRATKLSTCDKSYKYEFDHPLYPGVKIVESIQGTEGEYCILTQTMPGNGLTTCKFNAEQRKSFAANPESANKLMSKSSVCKITAPQ